MKLTITDLGQLFKKMWVFLWIRDLCIGECLWLILCLATAEIKEFLDMSEERDGFQEKRTPLKSGGGSGESERLSE